MKPKILVQVVFTNRYKNIMRWLKMWQAVPRLDEALCLICNTGVRFVEQEKDPKHRTIMIKRPNIGFDIGPMQDTILGRFDLPKWDWLYISPDDFLPMSPDFIDVYRRYIDEGVGLIGAYKSNRYFPPIYPHCRTGGFMISRAAADTLKWPANPIITKNQCWEFEHRSNNMLLQLTDNFGVRFLIGKDQKVIRDLGWVEKGLKVGSFEEFPPPEFPKFFTPPRNML